MRYPSYPRVLWYDIPPDLSLFAKESISACQGSISDIHS